MKASSRIGTRLAIHLFLGVVLIGATFLALGLGKVIERYLSTGDETVLQALSDALQNVAVTIAVIGGAVWSLFTFSALQVRGRAKAELASVKAQLERQASLRITLHAETIDFPGYQNYFVKVRATVANSGTRNTTIRIRSSLLFAEIVGVQKHTGPLLYSVVSPIGFHGWTMQDGDSKQGEQQQPSPVRPAADYVVRAGMEIDLYYLAQLPGPGTYHFQFETPLNAQEVQVMRGVGVDWEKADWRADTILTVPASIKKAVAGAHFDYNGPLLNTLRWCESALESVATYLHAHGEQQNRDPDVELHVLCGELADVRRMLLFNPAVVDNFDAVVAVLLKLRNAASRASIDVDQLQQAYDTDKASLLLTAPSQHQQELVPAGRPTRRNYGSTNRKCLLDLHSNSQTPQGL